ncbi:uncharacterized protein ASPGLDRAFT_51483 [Aspergillus glaucus CBS 516.65]|uniref:Uncharacterized protein n=1 Tax=Aspergillus glaucus CBS 516.65 TaxID=1160497 RepID=A0A1L9V9L6_ASPGL|nr:hypothetical protein ASPGLDRAFT_51483 [Aspergillus glaucus CBS 516.65]OJJ80627.1 hypothetical protein ASPGLDRAFT_51483 [Aspergillus glaucus CBS 516.65]
MEKGYGSICRVVWTGAGEGFELRKKDVFYTIWALSNHVNLVIDEGKEVSAEAQEKYQVFLDELQRTEHFPRYQKNHPETPLGKVYSSI